MKLTINLCTRGRPDLLRSTVSTTLLNMGLDDTRLVISVDEDDDATIKSLHRLPSDLRLHPLVMEREDSLGQKYDRALRFPADVYLVMVDYAPHVTPDFDRRILEAAAVFPDNIGVVFNRLANASFPQINAVTAGLVAKMGGIYPPFFPYWFVDHWLDDIARIINRIAYADVAINTSQRPGTQDLRDLEFWTTFFDTSYLRRRRQAHAIINDPDFLDPPWRKQLSLAHHPLIEQRSLWINDTIRADARLIEQSAGGRGLPDEARYQRLKARAVNELTAMVEELEAARAFK